MIVYDDLSSVSVPELMANTNWQSQYRLITQWGSLIHHKPALRLEENLLRGCETSAWLVHTHHNNVHRFAFDSDSRVIKGLAALLLAQVDNRTTQQIKNVDFSRLLMDVGLEKHLTPSRNNGLQAIVFKIKEIAV